MENDENIEQKGTGKRRSKKKIIIIIVIFAIIAITVTATIIILNKNKEYKEAEEESQQLTLYDTKLADYVKETEDGIKINTSRQLSQDKKIGELTVSGLQLTSKSGITTLIATVTNNTSENTKLQNIEVVFLSENKEELATAKGVVAPLNIGESTKINISMSSNYINAYDLEFRVR